MHTVTSNGSAPSLLHAFCRQYLCRRILSGLKTCTPLPPMLKHRSSWMHLRRIADMKFITAVILAFEGRPPKYFMIRSYHWPLIYADLPCISS
ncbi:hypothetical protein ARMGADRAFT_786996 [Armillaria gallica]|uniref:Uncharacterized protein n=1 Tax=Armillaria gallica TaxID=47427 RepID=A0A2H3E632_ARMGA|nr:hypothetical protein ARMGADRAFT_786996 [Armillaria gallica]